MVYQSLTYSRRLGFRVSLGIIAGTIAVAAGCTATPGSGYRDAYAGGRYHAAISGARAAAGSPGSTNEAALTTGLAHEALGNDAEARAWLGPIARGGDATMAAHASAGLALIDLRRGRTLQAAEALDSASLRMRGTAARDAARVAADAYERAGRPDDADRLRTRAAGLADAGGRASGGGFAVQVGAYSTRHRAQQRAAELRASARASGFGDPRVEPGGTSRRPLYHVRIGRFRTEDDANRARRLLGGESIVVGAS
ncbi:MAG: SPOR domain-containing protein [Planctomycetota bacterium]